MILSLPISCTLFSFAMIEESEQCDILRLYGWTRVINFGGKLSVVFSWIACIKYTKSWETRERCLMSEIYQK